MVTQQDGSGNLAGQRGG